MLRRLFAPILLTVLFLFPVTTHADDHYIRSQRLGITFISSIDTPTDEMRYQRALELGAGWNRWPMYWNRIETSAGNFDWSAYDRVVRDDIRHGLGIDAILLGIPEFHRDENRMAGLNEPIFSDGTDTYGEGKEINPENTWAVFVYEAVRRYMPGGTLAQEEGWLGDEGIRVWEIWNEPDFELFWPGSVRDYARLLKTAYIIIHSQDSEARVMFGGLIYNSDRNYLAQVLAIFEQDPQREENNWYMDIVGVHNYYYAWASGWLVLYVRQTLIAYRLERPIWLNESGASVWDDYPGPTWATSAEDRQLRLTQDQQAAFFIQSTAYAWAQGAEVVFFHQLYDDCGNHPPGTNFAPDEQNGTAHDAYGIYRNETTSVCFNQHPQPGTARPIGMAFRLLAETFGSTPFKDVTILSDVPFQTVQIEFDMGEYRIVIIWNRTAEIVSADFPALAGGTSVYLPDGSRGVSRFRFTDEGDTIYRLDLPPAIPEEAPILNPGDISAVGGTPYILVEEQPQLQ